MTYLVIFDLDGTLVDTPRAIVEAFTVTFMSMKVDAPEAAAIRATIGLPLERAFSTLLGVPPEDDKVTLGVRQYQVLFRELISALTREHPTPGPCGYLGRTLVGLDRGRPDTASLVEEERSRAATTHEVLWWCGLSRMAVHRMPDRTGATTTRWAGREPCGSGVPWGSGLPRGEQG
ncbi:MAG: HAD hydrolase-like protein [Pseudonocardiales bacterium]|nr:HAD hydrolase-like protein [Pseudonocardiales bacterium]MBV9029130.1 HAD hydrolase-like protein [Pseudonocardiales bacterium]MBW0009297.1 HAD hydrolase-like protein [Pseudonocardiales bacterium]